MGSPPLQRKVAEAGDNSSILYLTQPINHLSVKYRLHLWHQSHSVMSSNYDKHKVTSCKMCMTKIFVKYFRVLGR